MTVLRALSGRLLCHLICHLIITRLKSIVELPILSWSVADLSLPKN